MPHKLHVNGEFVSDPEELLDIWADHFSSLAKSNCDQCSDLKELHQQMDFLTLSSLSMKTISSMCRYRQRKLKLS